MRTPHTLALVFGIALTGCALDPQGAHDDDTPLSAGKADLPSDLCTATARAVVHCTGSLPGDFIARCQRASAGPEGESVQASLQQILDSAQDCVPAHQLWPTIDHQPSLGSKLFAAACTPVVLLVGAINRWRNSDIDNRDMRPPVRNRLWPVFGSSLDAAVIYYDADLISEWSIAGKDIEIGDIYGQTIGKRIYISDPYAIHSVSQDVTVGHEMVHLRQAQCFGGTSKFAFNYCEAYYKGGFRYSHNSLEIAAYALEDTIEPCVLADGVCSASLATCEDVGAD